MRLGLCIPAACSTVAQPLGYRLAGGPVAAGFLRRPAEPHPAHFCKRGTSRPLAEPPAANAAPLGRGTYRGREQPTASSPLASLVHKLNLCFKIFFPDEPIELTPKEEVKRWLKMVLVADRCGMSPGSLSDLKKTIARALQEFVDIDSEEAIEVNISNDAALGTVYCVAIPVRRVKAETRFTGDAAFETEGVLLEWDPADLNSDPSSRFPMGT